MPHTIHFPPGMKRLTPGQPPPSEADATLSVEIFERSPRHSGLTSQAVDYLSNARAWPLAAYYHKAVLYLEVADLVGYTSPDLTIYVEDSATGEVFFTVQSHDLPSVAAGLYRYDIEGPFGPMLRVRLVLDGTAAPQFVMLQGALTFRRKGSCACGGTCKSCGGG